MMIGDRMGARGAAGAGMAVLLALAAAFSSSVPSDEVRPGGTKP